VVVDIKQHKSQFVKALNETGWAKFAIFGQ